jgi:hypothetical protein
MTTVRELMERLKAGEVSFDEVLGEIEQRDWPTPPGPKTRAERWALALAECMPEPDDDSTFWVNVAFDTHGITAGQREQLVEPFRAWQRANDPPPPLWHKVRWAIHRCEITRCPNYTGFDFDVVQALNFYAADKSGRNLWAAALAWSRQHAEIQAELNKRKN